MTRPQGLGVPSGTWFDDPHPGYRPGLGESGPCPYLLSTIATRFPKLTSKGATSFKTTGVNVYLFYSRSLPVPEQVPVATSFVVSVLTLKRG